MGGTFSQRWKEEIPTTSFPAFFFYKKKKSCASLQDGEESLLVAGAVVGVARLALPGLGRVGVPRQERSVTGD